MNSSDVIATFALIASLLSAWVSYRAHRHLVSSKAQEWQLAFARERAELVVRIDRAMKTFDLLEKKLRNTLETITSAQESGHTQQAGNAHQLESDLEYLKGCQRQASSLWDETYNTNRHGLAHHKPQFLSLLEADEQFAKNALLRCKEMEKSLTIARNTDEHKSIKLND